MSTLTRRTNARALAVYTMVFLAVSALVFYPFWSQGRTFIYYYAGQERDGFTQHYTAFVYIGRYIRDFFAGLFRGCFELKHFDFTLGYGEDVIQSLGYYGFGDPLMLLSALVPQRRVSGFYQVYILLELWLAGLSFCLFGREKGYEDRWILPGALIYVFSGFALWAGLCHPEFLAPMIYFPLMLLGVERVLVGKRPIFLAVTTAVYALTGYYWLFVGTLFTCLYALVRFFEGKRGLKDLWQFFLRAAGAYVLGLMMAAPLFLPNVVGFLQSNRTGGERAMPALVATGEQARAALTGLIAPGSWNFAALGAVVLPALLLLFARREKKYRGLQILAALLSLFCVLPVVGWLCNAGAYESTRWYVFLNCFACFVVLSGLDELARLSSRTAMICALALLLYTWAVWNGGEAERLGLAALMGTVLLLLLLGGLRPRIGERTVCILLTLLVAANGVLNAHTAFREYVPMFAEAGLVEAETVSMPANVVPTGEVWQRVDQDYPNNPNASMLLDRAGVASYFSTSNGTVARFMSRMELPLYNKVLFPDLNGRAALNAMFSVRWFAGENGRGAPYGFKPVGNGVWEDNNVLPLGFTYDTLVSEEYWSNLSAMERQELLLRAAYVPGMTPAGETPESRLLSVSVDSVEGRGAYLETGELNAYEAGGSLILTFDGLPNSETYLRLPGVKLAWADTPRLRMTVQGGGQEQDYLFSSDNFLWHSDQESTLIHLGYFEQGLTQLTLTFEQPGGLKLDGVELWCLPMDDYEEQRAALRRESLTDIRVDTDHISGKITTVGRRVLAFAFPYSPGWTVEVDGTRAETHKVNDLLLGVELNAGEHTVTLRYHSPGFRIGLILAGCGLCGLGAMLLYRKKERKAA